MQDQTMKVLVFLAGTALSGGAFADNCNGTYHNVGHTADTQDIGAGVKITSFSGMSSNHWTEKAESRVGTCAGYAISLPDGKARVVYVCARKNAAGDVSVDEGSLEPGADKGNWKVTYATGALAGQIGTSGWWKPVVDNGKVTAGAWGGTCK